MCLTSVVIYYKNNRDSTELLPSAGWEGCKDSPMAQRSDSRHRNSEDHVPSIAISSWTLMFLSESSTWLQGTIRSSWIVLAPPSSRSAGNLTLKKERKIQNFNICLKYCEWCYICIYKIFFTRNKHFWISKKLKTLKRERELEQLGHNDMNEKKVDEYIQTCGFCVYGYLFYTQVWKVTKTDYLQILNAKAPKTERVWG